jgi:hypothetical protein
MQPLAKRDGPELQMCGTRGSKPCPQALRAPYGGPGFRGLPKHPFERRSDPPRPPAPSGGRKEGDSFRDVSSGQQHAPKPKGGPGFRGLPTQPFQPRFEALKTIRQDEHPRKSARSCSTSNGCASNEVCVEKAGSGQCVGQSCYMRGLDKEVCPMGQICVAKPRRDGAIISDVKGSCADRKMQCRAGSDCAAGWMCQTRPNGDGPVSDDGESGVCIHFGDGQAERVLSLV